MRSIAGDGYPAVTAVGDAGPAPMLQWLPIEQLVVDDTYQRPIAPQGRRNVQRIAERFQWPKFAPVVVAPVEGGRFAIIDGQHRTTVALLRGIAQVPCMIVPVDRRGQADAFGAINAGITRLTAVQLHRAAIAAGDPEALAIAAVCRSAGVKIVHAAQISQHNQVHGSSPAMTASVGAIAKHLAMVGEATLILSMRAIVAGTSTGALLTGQVLSAVCNTLHNRPLWQAEPDRLLAVFESIDLGDRLIQARRDAIQRRGVDAGTLLQAALTDRLMKKLGRAS